MLVYGRHVVSPCAMQLCLWLCWSLPVMSAENRGSVHHGSAKEQMTPVSDWRRNNLVVCTLAKGQWIQQVEW